MHTHNHEDELIPDPITKRKRGALIDKTNGAVNGFCFGVSYYDKSEYGAAETHDDQEGFYVLEGQGTAQVGSEEFPIRPGTAFIVANGTPHTMKRAADGNPIKVLWCHGAVR